MGSNVRWCGEARCHCSGWWEHWGGQVGVLGWMTWALSSGTKTTTDERGKDKMSCQGFSSDRLRQSIDVWREWASGLSLVNLWCDRIMTDLMKLIWSEDDGEFFSLTPYSHISTGKPPKSKALLPYGVSLIIFSSVSLRSLVLSFNF